jgi:hypothetical protein
LHILLLNLGHALNRCLRILGQLARLPLVPRCPALLLLPVLACNLPSFLNNLRVIIVIGSHLVYILVLLLGSQLLLPLFHYLIVFVDHSGGSSGLRDWIVVGVLVRVRGRFLLGCLCGMLRVAALVRLVRTALGFIHIYNNKNINL